MTLRQKQKVAVLFTKMSTLTPKNVQPPPLGSPSTERPQKWRILLGAQDVYTLRIWCRSPHAFPRYGLRNISRVAVDMDIHGYIHGYIHVRISDLAIPWIYPWIFLFILIRMTDIQKRYFFLPQNGLAEHKVKLQLFQK